MRRQVVLAAGGAGLLAMAGVAVVHAATEETGCSVTYRVQAEWPGGFLAAVDITNLGTPRTGWTLGFDFPDTGQRVVAGWNATWKQSQSQVTATSLDWNAKLTTDRTIAIGFVGNQSGTNSVPGTFTLNGVTCNGGTTPGPAPTPTPTATPTQTPQPTATPTPTPTASTPGPSLTPTQTATPTATAAPAGKAPALHVSGNKLLTADGRTYRMLGVNRSSGEFACVQGKGMWDGPADQATVDGMKTWNVHTVRIPLNEECWLGTNGTPGGATYQQNVKDYVNLLAANGITPIVEMHWNYGQYSGNGAGCSDTAATCQKPMPDAQNAPKFWTGVADMFKGDRSVVFDLFNEPFPDAPANWDATKSWTCWRDGGTCAGIGYEVAGMQSLVDAVRATGAENVIMVGGLTWSNDLRQWLEYAPKDPTGNLMAAWHTYNFNACSNTSCWDSQVAPVAAKVPVQAGEIGQDSCNHDYIDQVMKWLDAHSIGYLAWTWNPWGVCNSNGNVLITDWKGTPTSTFGEGFKAHLATQDPYKP